MVSVDGLREENDKPRLRRKCFSTTDHRGIVSPSIVEHSALVSVSQDEGAVLLCVAQGCPSVEYR